MRHSYNITPLSVRCAGLAAAAWLVGFSAPALAAPPAPIPHWTVQSNGSRLGFATTFAGDPVRGVFKRWSASIVFDPARVRASSLEVTVDMGSATTGDAGQDEALPGPDWFATSRFPKAVFKSTEISDLGGGRYSAKGVLTLRGVSKPLILPFTLAISGDVARANGEVSIDRSQFGVGAGPWRTNDNVPFPVKANFSLFARRAP